MSCWSRLLLSKKIGLKKTRVMIKKTTTATRWGRTCSLNFIFFIENIRKRKNRKDWLESLVHELTKNVRFSCRYSMQKKQKKRYFGILKNERKMEGINYVMDPAVV